jgi:hypothetical protein
MNVADLPLPLRLRNALLKAGFKTDEDIHDWLAAGPTTGEQGEPIPGVGATGMQQLIAWSEANPLRGTAPPAVLAQVQETVVEEATPEEAVARSTTKPQRHEVAGILDTAMRGGLEGLEAQLRRGEALVQSLGGERWARAERPLVAKDAGGPGPSRGNILTLALEADIQARIGALIPTIKALPHVKELGVDVSAETVGRMALIRGLDALERAHKGAQKSENPAPTAENREDQTPIPPPDDAEELSTPEGWTKCSPSDKIPVPEAVLHDYYTQNGWSRYWGMVEGTPIYFYWSPRRSLQELSAFPGTDKSGRKVAVQETPWGPGHVVPTKWSNA